MIGLIIIVSDKSGFYKYDRDSNPDLHLESSNTTLILQTIEVNKRIYILHLIQMERIYNMKAYTRR